MQMKVGIINSDGEKIPINGSNYQTVGGFDILDFPSTIPRSRRSPVRLELSWLHNELRQINAQTRIKRILEFSGGITTWTAYDAIKPDKYVCVEAKKFSRIFDPVREIYPKVRLVHNWFDIPKFKYPYDLVFIDGSSCMPKKLKNKYKVRDLVRRREALMYSEQYMGKGSIVVFHDWGHPQRNRGWRFLRDYVMESDKYEMMKVFKCNEKGFGIFRKLK
jgi:hypothetical protein